MTVRIATAMAGSGPVGPIPLSLHRQRVRIELPCGSCVHHGVCTIEEQVEQDVTLNVVGVGVPVRLYLGCSVYSKRRGPRDPAITERAWATRRASVEAKVMRTVHPKSRGRRTFPTHRVRAQPIDEPRTGG